MDARPSGSPRYEAALRRSVSRFRGCLGELEGQVLDVIELRAGVGSAPFSRVRVARRLKLSLPVAARLERQGLQRLLDASPNGCAGGAQDRNGTSANAAASAGSDEDAGAGAGITGGTGAAGGAPAGGASGPGAEGGVAGTSAEGGTARRESGASPSDEALLQRIMPGDGPVGTAIAAPLGLLTLLALAGGFVAVRTRRRREAASSDAWRAVPDA